MKRTHLQDAKDRKDDEFYTRYDDIEKELGSYDWSNKIVGCPADSLGAYYIFGADGIDDSLENFLKKSGEINNMSEKISGVYKITNTITGDFYIGSSKDIKSRWKHHKCPSVWNEHPNNPMYLDMKKYGVDKLELRILAEVEPEQLKEAEQHLIEKMHPTYNNINAKGFDFERRKEYKKEYRKSDKYKESQKKAINKYKNQLCCYNGEKLTLNALALRFYKSGIEHCVLEAKKYILRKFY